MKSELRKNYQLIRKQIPKPQRMEASRKILAFLDYFLAYPRWLLYASMEDEFPTQEIFEYLSRHQREIYFPRLEASEMKFYQVREWDELRATGRILEPQQGKSLSFEKPGLCLVPGLVFHRSGQRIGFGKAYYDRYLAKHPELFRLGLSFSEQIHLDEWPSLDTDEPMDMILTPDALWASPRDPFKGPPLFLS